MSKSPLAIVATLALLLTAPFAAAHHPGHGTTKAANSPGKVTTDPHIFTLKELVIEQPWVRATPDGARVAGGFFKITNKGTKPDRLIGGSFAQAARFEVHEMAATDGVMRMRELAKGLEIKPGETVELKPGGYHVMFMDLKVGLKAGDTLKGTLVFAEAGTIEVEYYVTPRTETSKDGHKH